MKNFMYYMAAATLVFGSCTQDEIIEQTISAESAAPTLFAGFQTDSRINLVDKTLTWAVGDQFTVYDNDGTNSSNYTLKSGENTKNGTFQATPGGTSKAPAIAVFPNLPGKLNGNKLEVTLPETYSAKVSQNAPMVGLISGNKVTFQHCTALLKFKFNNLPEGFNTVKIVCSTGIAGNLKIEDITAADGLNLRNNNVDPNSPDGAMDKVKGKTVTITDVTKETVFYLPIPAVSVTRLEVFANNGKEDATLYTISSKTFENGKMYTVEKSNSYTDYIYNQANFTMTDDPKSCLGKWFALNNLNDLGTVTPEKEYLKLDGKKGGSPDEGVVAGFSFDGANFKKDVYRIDFKIQCDKAGDAGRMSIACESSYNGSKKPMYFPLTKAPEKFLNIEKGSNTSFVPLEATVGTDKWETLSFYVDFSKYGEGASSKTPIIDNPETAVGNFNIRIYGPREGCIMHLKEIKVSDVNLVK